MEPNGGSTVRDSSRFRRPSLRQATVVFPSTGEHLRKRITLRDDGTAPRESASDDDDILADTTLLPLSKSPRTTKSWAGGAYEAGKDRLIKSANGLKRYLFSRNGKGVLKCSLAYLLATFTVLLPAFTHVLGTGDGKHLAANIVVWYHPARSAGSMEQGFVYALAAFTYSVTICALSMSLSACFAAIDRLVVGHVMVLIICCCGGLGFLAYVKQKKNNPLINVSISLAAIPIVTTITKDPAVYEGEFSPRILSNTARMAVMAIVLSTVVCVLFWPIRARRDLRQNLVESTTSLAEIIGGISSSFLAGLEDDMKHPAIVTAADKFNTNMGKIDGILDEARNEYLLLGRECQYHIEERLVHVMELLAQDLGGLRSAAEMQFALLAESVAQGGPIIEQPPSTAQFDDNTHSQETVLGNPSAASAAEIFITFIDLLGPPMKSLAYTLKQIFRELPFGPGPDFQVIHHPILRKSLVDALELYKKSRKVAVKAVYESKEITRTRQEAVAADFEEVAASCGHFSSSLEDIGEHCVEFLDVLGELDLETSGRSNRRSWWWLCFWRRNPREGKQPERRKVASLRIPSLGVRRHNNLPEDEKNSIRTTIRYRLWRGLASLRTDEVCYAVKVGVGAALLAMLAFIPATRDTFRHWRLEWAVSTYMFACSMTLGQANTVIVQRIEGVIIGAGLAIGAWVIARGNAVLLGLCGWAISYGCFYIMNVKNQGPMSRFILLTYNLTTLYSYSLSVNDQTRDEDEGGIDPHIWEIALHRFIAIVIGCVWGLIITRVIWPIVARQKLRSGLSLLWLRMGLIWTKAPLSILMEPEKSATMDIRDEMSLRKFAGSLNTLWKNAGSEFMLRGPFPSKDYKTILDSTSRMLDSIHALNIVITKDLKASPGEMELLQHTAREREQLAKRISHLLNVLASSMQLEFPINDVLPSIAHARDRLLAKLFEIRRDPRRQGLIREDDYELLYTYALVTAQLAKEISTSSGAIEKLYGTLSDDILKLS